MKGFLVGGLLFVALALLSWAFPVTGSFNLVHGLFDNNDIGTIVGIIVALLVGVLCFQISAIASVFVGAFVNDQ